MTKAQVPDRVLTNCALPSRMSNGTVIQFNCGFEATVSCTKALISGKLWSGLPARYKQFKDCSEGNEEDDDCFIKLAKAAKVRWRTTVASFPPLNATATLFGVCRRKAAANVFRESMTCGNGGVCVAILSYKCKAECM